MENIYRHTRTRSKKFDKNIDTATIGIVDPEMKSNLQTEIGMERADSGSAFAHWRQGTTDADDRCGEGEENIISIALVSFPFFYFYKEIMQPVDLRSLVDRYPNRLWQPFGEGE